MEKELRSLVSISILLLPIQPIKPSVYGKLISIFEQFNSFSTQELINLPLNYHHQTTNTNTTATTTTTTTSSSSNSTTSNQIQFNFLNHYQSYHHHHHHHQTHKLSSDSNHLNTFQPHRHLIGVIGIIDCQEWSSSQQNQSTHQSLQDAYNSFKSTLETHYPRTLLAKCFGFNPIDSQADNVNGLVIIPHIGDQSFYVNRLMADFASDLIIRFRHLSSLLQSVSTLNSPHPSIHESIFDLLPLIPPLASSFNTHPNHPQSTSSSPSRSNHPQKPIQSAPKARQPLAHLLTDLEKPSQTATPPASPRPQHTTHSLSLNAQSSNPRSLSPNLNSQSLQKPHRAFSDSLSPSQPTSNPVSNPRPTSLLIDSRARKKLSGRIKKFDADLCLMIGELEEAVKLYTQAISISRTSNDLVWLASALEGLSLTKVMIHIRDHHQVELSATNPNLSLDPGVNLVSLINEVIDSYEQALAIYSKPIKLDPNSSDHLPPIIYVETGLRLLTIRGTLWKAYHESKPIHEALWTLFGFKSTGTTSKRSKERTDEGNLMGLSRHSISELASRVYIPELVNLVPSDRIRSLSELIYWYDQIDYQRKSAWMKRELIGVMLQTLNAQQLLQQSQNLVRLMNEIFKVYKLEIDGNLMKEETEEIGWLDIKIGLIKDGIILFEKVLDQFGLLKLNLKLSNLLHCQIKNDELYENGSHLHDFIMQDSLRLMDQIPKLLNRVKIDPDHLIWWGPEKMVLAIELMSLSKKLEPIPKLLKKSNPITNPNLKPSTFFYVPVQSSMKLGSSNARSSKKIGTLVLEEPVVFLITLQNPLLFELEISEIKLSTTGVKVSSQPYSIKIGPSSIKTIKLVCWPKEVGSLFVKGTWIVLGSEVNSVQKEFLVPMVLANGKKIKEDLFMECLVVDRLPVLKIVPASRNLVQRYLTIWDGEKVMIEFEIENESKVGIGWKEVEVIDDRQTRIKQELKRSSLSKIYSTEEIYQLEYELFFRPSLRVIEDERMDGNQRIRIQVEGKIGVGSGLVLVRYGGIEGGNWMRECKEEIRFTVLDVIEVVDFLVWEDGEDGSEKCWVGIKVKNVLGNGKALEVGFDCVDDRVVGKQRVEAGSTVLIFTSIKKISLTESELQVPIPSLDPNRQFVIASSIHEDEDEDHGYEKDYGARNEAFWIREKVLESIQVSWNEIDGIRNGNLDLRRMINRFDQKIVRVLRAKEIEILVLNRTAIECIGIEEFVEIHVKFTNRTQREMKIGFEIGVRNEEVLLVDGVTNHNHQPQQPQERKTIDCLKVGVDEGVIVKRSLIGIGFGKVKGFVNVWENGIGLNTCGFQVQVV